MKAAIYDQPGAPDVLHYKDVPDPVCPRDGVVIVIEAIAPLA
jgi:NADPH:quinone reductase-like Zn-dependent oxidoreductase